MKQIRVKSPFLDITASNQRREVGDILLVTEERAAYLVSGKLCEYVKEDEGKRKKDNNPEPQTPAPTEPAEQTQPTEPAEPTEPASDGENGEGGKEADNGDADEGKKESKAKNTKGSKK